MKRQQPALPSGQIETTEKPEIKFCYGSRRVNGEMVKLSPAKSISVARQMDIQARRSFPGGLFLDQIFRAASLNCFFVIHKSNFLLAPLFDKNPQGSAKIIVVWSGVSGTLNQSGRMSENTISDPVSHYSQQLLAACFFRSGQKAA
ncbi:MAG: hypothetical protein ABI977_17470 [Acidobacteriota bacterium]